MSTPIQDLRGGIDYALTKRHYDNDDYVSIAFGAVQDYYVVGTMAAVADPNVIDVLKGWTLFSHGQPATPAFLAAVLAALGITWPSETPSFEAKDLLFYATQDMWLRFEGASRVQHLIPANTFMRFHRRCFMFFVQAVNIPGVCRVWLEG